MATLGPLTYNLYDFQGTQPEGLGGHMMPPNYSVLMRDGGSLGQQSSITTSDGNTSQVNVPAPHSRDELQLYPNSDHIKIQN